MRIHDIALLKVSGEGKNSELQIKGDEGRDLRALVGEEFYYIAPVDPDSSVYEEALAFGSKYVPGSVFVEIKAMEAQSLEAGVEDVKSSGWLLDVVEGRVVLRRPPPIKHEKFLWDFRLSGQWRDGKGLFYPLVTRNTYDQYMRSYIRCRRAYLTRALGFVGRRDLAVPPFALGLIDPIDPTLGLSEFPLKGGLSLMVRGGARKRTAPPLLIFDGEILFRWLIRVGGKNGSVDLINPDGESVGALVPRTEGLE